MPCLPEENVPLAPLTTWKIGGPAEWYVAPETEDELAAAVQWANEKGLPIHILGRGSNVLIADEGLKGLVISTRKLVSSQQSWDRHLACLSGERDRQDACPTEKSTHYLEVPAGLSLPRFSKLVAGHGYSGYEFYIGIPGTVGGAVAMNAGFGPGDERQTANRCVEVQTLSKQGIGPWRPYTDFNPVYRHTDFLENGEIVLRARFSLKEESTKEEIRAETAKHLEMRRSRQPLTRPTAGSVFRGTDDGVPAAVYIDRCGLKGFRVGGAIVSEKHANWIENTGGAQAKDVEELIRHMQKVVLSKEGIQLQPEVRFLH